MLKWGRDTDLAVPGRNAPEVQANRGMRVGELLGQPRRACGDGDAQFFLELADQGFTDTFAGFHLAPRELPVVRIDLAFRALGKQKFLTIRP